MATKQAITPLPDESSEESGPSKEEVFEVLSNRRRRQTLHYLLQKDDETATKREVSRQLAAWENDEPIDMVSSSERKRVYIALHQTHLPKLADAGLVDYDASQGTITLTDACHDLDVYLDVVPENELSWSQFYLGLGGLCLALTALAGLGLVPFDGVPGLAWAGLFAVAVTVAGGVHYLRDNQHQLGVDAEPPLLGEGE
ncbi:DUF7344 domain-containing protein [Haloarchaeobius amylolyticus]|uniref:DUF7344 domain-containing protein n=1 Tax=Haloarchaeobius amylolyticus TaxID=1198296 RepID=UPI00226EF1FC|nr:hypothetical protein [Haloarchaeobius amylolyticus]